jgi:hypothetical protein
MVGASTVHETLAAHQRNAELAICTSKKRATDSHKSPQRLERTRYQHTDDQSWRGTSGDPGRQRLSPGHAPLGQDKQTSEDG